MKNSKLFYLLKSLNPEEFRWFNKFIRSPYFNSNQHLIKLNELIKKYNRDFEHPRLNQLAIFKHLFPGEKLDEQRLRLLFHRMAKLVEQFLVVDRLKKNEMEHEKLLIKCLERSSTYELFAKKTNTLLKELEENHHRNETYYQERKELYLQYYSHPATNRHKSGLSELELASDSLDDFYALSKVKLACAIQARKRTLSEDYQFKYLKLAQEHIEDRNILGSIYSRILLLQEHEVLTPLFEEVKELFINHIHETSQEDRRNILSLLLNYIMRLVNKGNSELIVYIFELYNIGLESDCLIINNELTETTYTNIIVSGIGSGEFSWVEDFIEKYSTYLNQTVRESAMTYGMAFWYFHQGQFDEAIEKLSTYTFSKTLQIVSAKTLMIRCYIELFSKDDSYFELSMAQLNTFEKYVRKSKGISKTRGQAYLNFVSATKKLLNLKMKRKDLREFESKLKSSQNLVLKNWLIKKTNQK